MNKSYSLHDNYGIKLDLKLDALFKKRNGVFIELGANDGLDQSNTAFLEFNRNWTGILIEPSPSAYVKCKTNRPNSIVLNYACVSDDYLESYITGDFDGKLMNSINGLRLGSNNLISVPAKKLEAILDEYNFKDIDLLSLDTEGYELNILKGLNLDKYKPTYILVEIYNHQFDEIKNYLESKNYILLCNFSNYNKKDNPVWDGSHNDYLFTLIH